MTTPRPDPRFAGTAVAVLVTLLSGGVLSGLFVGVMGVSRWLGLGLLALGTVGAAPLLLALRTRPVARWFCAGVVGGLTVAWLATAAAVGSGIV